MCGINGILSKRDSGELEQIVGAMNRAMGHRGPDDEGCSVLPGIGLGHRRLSIIDLSAHGHQPMSSADGRYEMVFNGEIYNFKEIKADLTDYPFKSETDSEMILAAWTKWGLDCMKRFNGMFALAIWDKQKETLVVARDRLGIKPLYYYHQGGELVFASEIRSLLASGIVPRQLDQEGLVDYLRYQTVHAPRTILKDVHALEPGQWMEFKPGASPTSGFYWTAWEDYEKTPPHTYAEAGKKVKDLLYKSVERRLMADVPFGAFLSGGIDSSAIVGIMSQVSNLPVKTFSVIFDDNEFSEAPYAGMIAKKFNTDHHPIQLTVEDFRDEVPHALKAMDHPSGDGPNTYVVSKVTREAGITVALSGLGGDELFAGYDIFNRSLSLQEKKWLNTFPRPVRKIGGQVLRTAKPGIASDKIASVLELPKVDLYHSYPVSRQILLDKDIQKLVGKGNLAGNAVAELMAKVRATSEGKLPLLSQVSLAEIYSYMQNVLLRDTDQMSMAHALEVRVPFLDHELVEYALGIPDKFKRPLFPKKLLVEALDGLLPDEIVHRPKMGFTLPWKHWMKTDLASFCEEKINSLASRSPVQGEVLKHMYQRFLNNDPGINWSRIWALVVLENWLNEHDIR